MYGELKVIRIQVVVTYFKIPSRHSPGNTEHQNECSWYTGQQSKPVGPICWIPGSNVLGISLLC